MILSIFVFLKYLCLGKFLNLVDMDKLLNHIQGSLEDSVKTLKDGLEEVKGKV